MFLEQNLRIFHWILKQEHQPHDKIIERKHSMTSYKKRKSKETYTTNKGLQIQRDFWLNLKRTRFFFALIELK